VHNADRLVMLWTGVVECLLCSLCVCVCVRARVCAQPDDVDSKTAPKQRYHVQPTKKLDCPVLIHMKKLIVFPQFKVTLLSFTGREWRNSCRSYSGQR